MSKIFTLSRVKREHGRPLVYKCYSTDDGYYFKLFGALFTPYMCFLFNTTQMGKIFTQRRPCSLFYSKLGKLYPTAVLLMCCVLPVPKNCVIDFYPAALCCSFTLHLSSFLIIDCAQIKEYQGAVNALVYFGGGVIYLV